VSLEDVLLKKGGKKKFLKLVIDLEADPALDVKTLDKLHLIFKETNLG